MANVCRLQLDVLKPHKPNAYDFSVALADLEPDWKIRLKVIEIDEKTETICLDITGTHIDYEKLQAKIIELGATIHSIDAVDAHGSSSN